MRNAIWAGLVLALATPMLPAQSGWAEKMFKDGTSHNFGSVPRGAELFYQFSVTNIYAVPMEITGVQSGCGCVTATPAKRVLQPREQTTIDITMDAKRFTGAKTVVVRVDVGPNFISRAELKVTANARADVVFNPGQVDFKTVNKGQSVAQTIDVEYAGTLDWRVTEVVVAKDQPFEASIKDLYRRPGQVGYQLRVVLKGDAPVGPLKESIYLKTNDPASPTVPVVVEANIQSALMVSPNLLTLERVKVGDTITRKVVVRSSKPFRIIGLEGVGDGISLGAELSPTASTVQFVTLRCQFSTPGEFRREVKIKTDLQDSTANVILEGNTVP
jgi:hypothetical protein